MREIKFRTPHIDIKTGKFSHFSYWGAVDTKGNAITSHDCFASPSSSSNTKKEWHQQFTGLKDKNGKEVYEGDIVDYGNGRNKVVEFIDGCFCICGITAMPKLMTLYPVIGNIYENPELLK
jgi:uncharacterized phage protein (TIGR01671 family)